MHSSVETLHQHHAPLHHAIKRFLFELPSLALSTCHQRDAYNQDVSTLCLFQLLLSSLCSENETGKLRQKLLWLLLLRVDSACDDILAGGQMLHHMFVSASPYHPHIANE